MKYNRGILDIGDAPYELVRPALLKIENPEQLVGLLNDARCKTLTATSIQSNRIHHR